MNEEILGVMGDNQDIDFVKKPAAYAREIKAITSLMDDGLLQTLEEVGAFIAGGALTSVFSNKEVNDIDVYLPSAEAFTTVLRKLYGESDDDSKYSSGFDGGRVSFYTSRSVTVVSNGVKVQLIVYKWHDSAESIFKDFDFTVNMAAINLATNELTMHPNFLKHLSQRYLSFNTATAYPLISALRVDKYRQRGYTISKAQMLRVLMAINNKNIDSWEVLCDELGGMYGLDSSKLLDTTQEFSMEKAMEQLDKVEVIPNKMFVERDLSFHIVLDFLKDRVDQNYYNWRKANANVYKWSPEYKEYDATVTYPAAEKVLPVSILEVDDFKF